MLIYKSFYEKFIYNLFYLIFDNMIVSKTPFRISIGGGGTDLPFYYTKKEGTLISATINKYIYIIVQKRQFDTFLIRYSKTEVVKNVKDIQHELIREALILLNITDPIEITSVSDFPAKTGLGSSSSFLVGLLNALHEYKNERVSKKKLAEEATKIQTDILKKSSGLQDQYAASFGSLISMNINRKGRTLVTPVDISDELLTEIENKLVFLYTGIKRSAEEILKEQKAEAEIDEDKIIGLTQIKKIGLDIKKALETGNLRKFGLLMNLHWEVKKSLSAKMTNSQIDEWYQLAIKNGAIGGKIMGAGGGGFLMFFVDKNKEAFVKAMQEKGELIHVPCKFDYDGTKIIINER